jgi:hypothetical protein
MNAHDVRQLIEADHRIELINTAQLQYRRITPNNSKPLAHGNRTRMSRQHDNDHRSELGRKQLSNEILLLLLR